MRFRRLLASLLAVTLIAGLPVASAQAAGPDCVTTSDIAAGDGCASDMAGCMVACAAAVAAVGESNAYVVPLYAGSPLDGTEAQTRSVSRPPDTAPPKPFAA